MPDEPRGDDARQCVVTEATEVVPDELHDAPHPRPASRRWTRAVRTARLAISADQAAFLAIVTAVLLANLPSLLGFFDPNPLDFRSGLTSAITHGWFSGKPTIDPSNGFTS